MMPGGGILGHLHHSGHEHVDLAARLRRGPVAMVEPRDTVARQAWQEIMEILFTPADAALAARLPVLPTPAERLARRLHTNPERLRRHLDDMADRGLVLDLRDRSGKTLYLLAPPVVGFFEFSMMRLDDGLPKARLARAYQAYMEDDREFLDEIAGARTVVGRALLHQAGATDDLVSEVLDWQRATSCVQSAGLVAVTNCFCRHAAQHLGTSCTNPLETCLSLGVGAAHLIRHGLGRQISAQEALALLEAARESGLVLIADNVQQHITYICSCCGCCCVELRSVQMGASVVQPSGFQPVPDVNRCTGCARCVRACPVQAISLVPKQPSVRGDGEGRKSLVSRVDLDRCIGCGVCVDVCREKALALRRAPGRHVPLNPIEFMTRRMLERGRLADLLIDGTAGRGPAFANAVLSAVLSLPPAQRLLAAEALQSRFVRYALSHYEVPGSP